MRGDPQRQLREAKDELASQQARIVEMARSHRRLEHLYEISKLLTRVGDIDRMVPELLALVARTLPIQGAILILAAEGEPTMILWDGHAGEERLEAAATHARAAYDYLVGPRVGRSSDRAPRRARSSGPPSRPSAPSGAGDRFIILPLVVDHGGIFGALQFDGPAFDEESLSFVNAVVNQLAVAIDRQAHINARQAAVEAEAQEQRLLAEVGAVVAASLDPAATIAGIARCAVPLFADVCVVEELGASGLVDRQDVIFADAGKQRAFAERMRHASSQSAATTRAALGIDALEPVLEPAISDVTAHDGLPSSVVLRDAGMRSKMVLPMFARSARIGVLTFAASHGSRPYGPGIWSSPRSSRSWRRPASTTAGSTSKRATPRRPGRSSSPWCRTTSERPSRPSSWRWPR